MHHNILLATLVLAAVTCAALLWVHCPKRARFWLREFTAQITQDVEFIHTQKLRNSAWVFVCGYEGYGAGQVFKHVDAWVAANPNPVSFNAAMAAIGAIDAHECESVRGYLYAALWIQFRGLYKQHPLYAAARNTFITATRIERRLRSEI